MAKNKAVYLLHNEWIERVSREVAGRIAPEFEVVFVDPEDETAVQEQLPDADFVVCLALKPEWVPLLKKCKLVQHNGVGYDAIDLPGLQNAGIPLAISPEFTAVGVAEHVLMVMLALSRQLIPIHNSLVNGEFEMFSWRAGSTTLYGRTVGILGLGRIGKQVAKTVHAFGAKIIFNDIVAPPDELVAGLDLTAVSFETLLAQSDILTVHVPLTSVTRKMFQTEQFMMMKQGALYINASRGPTFSLNGLVDALKAGHLRGAGVDVYDPEPPEMDHPIFKLSNVICTPHLASGTIDRHIAIVEGQFANAKRVLRGERPLHEIME